MRILMVCLGNICRSPLAEGIMQRQLDQAGIQAEVDSAGTIGWHSGEVPDHRSIAVAANNGIDISKQKARKVVKRDFGYFDLIFAMDFSNYRDLLAMAETDEESSRIQPILAYAGIDEIGEVPDPYYGNTHDFEQVYALLDSACKLIVKKLQA
jgi:protein-tyrosine phosphatase